MLPNFPRRLLCLLVVSFFGFLAFSRGYTQGTQAASRYYYAVENLDTGEIVRRGETTTNGIPRGGIILAPNSNYREWLFEADTGLIGFSDFRTPSPGRPFTIPPVNLGLSLTPDTDGDGLSDDAERIVNGNPNDPYSFFEGVLDGDAVRLGLINNSGIFTGIIGSVDTSGTAVDVCAFNDIVAVANSAEGISVFNVFNRMAPLIIAQVDTPGIATAVACSDNFIAVADGAAGLAIVDIGDASNSRIIHQINLGGSAQAVAAAGGLAFAGTANGNLSVVDMASGFVLQQENIGEVEDLVVEGNSLFAYAGGRLVIRTNIFGALQPAGSANSPGNINANYGRGRIFSGGGYAYLVHNRGYNIFSVTNLNQPILVANIITPQFGWKQIVFNGSGSVLAVASPNQAFDGPHNVFLYDVADPGAFGEFNSEFTTPGVARSATIYNGLAYVADHLNGLQVLNYKSVDFAGSPPTISLMPSFTLASSTNGVVEEGQIVRITANVSDDIQVRNVEFYIDGIRAATDGNFPFEYEFVAPRRVSQASFGLQARASDTGGNFQFTDPILVDLLPDITSPRLVGTFPQNQSLLTAATNLVVFFNEPIDPQSLTSNELILVSSGQDHRLDTADDERITHGTFTYTTSINGAFLTFSSSLDLGQYRVSLGTNVTDLAGNRLGSMPPSSFWVLPDGADGDADDDGLLNAPEIARGTNPLLWDTDGDGWDDGVEVADARDPLDPSSVPAMTLAALPPVELNLITFDDLGLSGNPFIAASPLLQTELISIDQTGFQGHPIVRAYPDVEVEKLSLDQDGFTGQMLVLSRPDLEVYQPSRDNVGETGASTFTSLPSVAVEISSSHQLGSIGSPIHIAIPEIELSLITPNQLGETGNPAITASPQVHVTFSTNALSLFQADTLPNDPK